MILVNLRDENLYSWAIELLSKRALGPFDMIIVRKKKILWRVARGSARNTMHDHCASTICPNQASLCFRSWSICLSFQWIGNTPCQRVVHEWNVYRLWVSFHQLFFFRKQDTHLGRGNGIPNLDLRLQCPAQYGYSFVYTTLLPEWQYLSWGIFQLTFAASIGCFGGHVQHQCYNAMLSLLLYEISTGRHFDGLVWSTCEPKIAP